MNTAHKRLITGTVLAAAGLLALDAYAFNVFEFSNWTQVGVAPNGGTFIYATASSVRGTFLPLDQPGQTPLYSQIYAVGSVDHKMYLSEGGAWTIIAAFNGQGASPSFYSRPAAAAFFPSRGDNRVSADARNIVVGLDSEGSIWQNVSGSDGSNVGELWGQWHRVEGARFFSSTTSVSDGVGVAITPYPGFMRPNGLFMCALSTQGIGTPLQTPLFKSVYCARNTDRLTATGPFTANSWTAFAPIPNTGLPGFTYISRGPALVTDMRAGIWVSIQMTNGKYYWNRSTDNGVTWQGWTQVPQPAGTPALASLAPNLSAHLRSTADIFLVAAGSSAGLALTSGDASFSQLPNAAFRAAPAVFADGQYRMEASAIGLDGQVWRAVWSSPDGN